MKSFVSSYAHHYRAFRPPLHYLILKNCLGKRKFKKTLDIGCGVGNSTIALTNFSKKVIGYDINKEMLKSALQHKRVSYIDEWSNIKYDLLCFFGSLNYIQQNEIHNFLNVLKPSGYIICCDFKIFYNRFTDFLNLKIIKNKYDYEKNLGSYNLAKEIKQINSDSMLLNFDCNIKEFVHLILTEKNIKNVLIDLMGEKELDTKIEKKIGRLINSEKLNLDAMGYYTLHKKI